MSERKLLCEIVSPEEVVYSGEVSMVVAPAADGEIGFLPLHTPLVTTLDIGILRVKSSQNRWEYIAVHGGYLEVREDRVTVLADSAELASRIDVAQASEAKERAETRIEESRGKREDFYEAEKALRWALARLRAARGVETTADRRPPTAAM
ncbi:MAG: F0F1 ATP synthase subunit epsilon [Actinobacteria bacterium]|nr:F0F1 ATP synthase subunit epsilon [Actinomycetota bacterium]